MKKSITFGVLRLIIGICLTITVSNVLFPYINNTQFTNPGTFIGAGFAISITSITILYFFIGGIFQIQNKKFRLLFFYWPTMIFAILSALTLFKLLNNSASFNPNWTFPFWTTGIFLFYYFLIVDFKNNIMKTNREIKKE